MTQSSSSEPNPRLPPSLPLAQKLDSNAMPMDKETPAWLADPESGTLSSPAAPQAPPPTALPPPGVKTGDSRIDDLLPSSKVEPEANLFYYILIMRVGNLAAMALLGTASVFAMILTVEVDNIILGVYGVLFALLVFLFETNLWFVRKRITSTFGFLFSPLYRSLFYALLAAVAYSYDSTLGLASCVVTASMGAFNLYVLVMFPSYREERDKIAKDEDAKLQQRMDEEVKKRAVAQVRSR